MIEYGIDIARKRPGKIQARGADVMTKRLRDSSQRFGFEDPPLGTMPVVYNAGDGPIRRGIYASITHARSFDTSTQEGNLRNASQLAESIRIQAQLVLLEIQGFIDQDPET